MNRSMPGLPVHHQLPEFTHSRPLSRWCHPAISSSVISFSYGPQSLPASECFPMSQLFTWGGQGTGISASASVLPKNTRTDLLQNGLAGSPCSPKTRWTFVGKVMSLLFNMLSRLVITFLPRRKRLLISWLQSPSAVILEPSKIFIGWMKILEKRSIVTLQTEIANTTCCRC